MFWIRAAQMWNEAEAAANRAMSARQNSTWRRLSRDWKLFYPRRRARSRPCDGPLAESDGQGGEGCWNCGSCHRRRAGYRAEEVRSRGDGSGAGAGTLEKAFKSAGLQMGPYRKSIEEADKATRRLGFSDEDAKNSLGSLLVATKSFKESREDLNVAMDVARFKSVDLPHRDQDADDGPGRGHQG